MCFSSTISFSTAAALIPLGIYGANLAWQRNPQYITLAFIPLMFGLQQLMEGFVWHYSHAGNEEAMLTYGRGFTFFSHFFWLFWIPLTAWLLETEIRRKKVFFIITIAGFISGLWVYIPLLQDGYLEISIIEHSIYYETHIVTHEVISKNILRLGYAIIVLAPLLLSSTKILGNYGVLTAVSIAVTFLFYQYAFVSVWCFFAAFLSSYIVYQLIRSTGPITIKNTGR